MTNPISDRALPEPGAELRRVHIKSFGCQMNAHDAERMADLLAKHGYAATGQVEEADVVILNTCHIRERASEKVYSELGRLRERKEERLASGKTTRIVVAGCVAQAEGTEITRREKAVDVVVGPQSYHNLPALLKAAETGTAMDTDFPELDKFAALPAPDQRRLLARGPSAFLTVQEGCNKFCSFCVVPFTRGAEFSRPVSAILDEARGLVEAGIRDIMLLGQNVNAYHGARADGGVADLAALFAALAKIVGLERLRYATSHPRDMNKALIEAHKTNPKLMPYLHLPVQSGSDRVLKAMNRRHSTDEYRRIIDAMREARPDIALSSDFIIGFPGETEADFAATMALVREIGFAAAYSFTYSPRPGTKAAEGTDDVPQGVKTERLHALQALILEQQTAFNRASLGKTLPVLFEKLGRYDGQVAGKSPYLQAVHVDMPQGRIAKDYIGAIMDVRITKLASNSLHGEIISADHSASEGGYAA